MTESDILKDALGDFEMAQSADAENRADALDDINFARLGEQWPETIKTQRSFERRPCLTINRLPSFIRNVHNDARMNKPAIRVRPADSGADKEIAKVYEGLIRHIQTASDAEIAFDRAGEDAITSGRGYFRINVGYSCDDTFDQDITIDSIGNPFSVYGDPYSTKADSSDWNKAFVVDMMTKAAFASQYPDAAAVDFDNGAYAGLSESWGSGDEIQIAEYWVRSETMREILLLNNGQVIAADVFEANRDLFEASGVGVQTSRKAKSHKVMQHLITGAEVLQSTEWAGRWIPIVPVLGDEVNVEGKRYFRSLIRDAKDAQRMFNYWRTIATELQALAPRAPFIGPEEAFTGQYADRWSTANTDNHPFLAYKGLVAPQRQPFTAPASGALQEALIAADDMKAIIGLYDSSLGQRSNETSGKAILARQREGDIATFHFTDNLSRALKHAGRILIDLIPLVYSAPRLIRVLGEDGQQKEITLGAPIPPTPPKPPMPGETPEQAPVPMGPQPPMPPQGAAAPKIYDLGIGKYDLVVEAGPSFSTRRVEAATQMTELLRAFPQAAPILGDLLAKNFDWPGADEVAERLRAMVPQGNPQMQKAMQEVQKLQQDNAKLAMENAALKGSVAIDQQKLQIEEFKAVTDRMQAMKPDPAPTVAAPERMF